jgi:hypothetical protein
VTATPHPPPPHATPPPAQGIEDIVGAFDPSIPIARASTPPSAWYRDAQLAELERRHVFSSSWQPVARVEQLGQPGAYVSGCFAGEPWLIVRGRDDTLRAFYKDRKSVV